MIGTLPEAKSAGVARNGFSGSVEVSASPAKRFLDALFAADFYSRENFTITVRQLRRA